MTPKEHITLMVVSGEPSGDRHAARLVGAIKGLLPNAQFFGSAGPLMREADVDTVVHADELSVIGLPEITAALPMFWKAYRKLIQAAEERKPDAVILVDFPDFNLKLAKSLKRRGFKVIYYISPQLWAWRKYRLRTIRNYVDLVISILPFEKDWYEDHGVNHVEYVGSPLAREVHPSISNEEFCFQHSLDTERPIIALLPGSRRKEITKILPVMLETAVLMLNDDPNIQFCIALADNRLAADVESIIGMAVSEGRFGGERPKVVLGETYDLLNAADAAAVTSGTATLETGILGTPMAVVYKTSILNYKLLRPLIDVEHFGLINLIAGERVAKELIQDEFTPELLAEELFRLLEPEANVSVRRKLNAAADKLGHGGASKRAAQAIINLLTET